jgi:beta-phosphoglucomutase-like phosphatase (HAD superfamily)
VLAAAGRLGVPVGTCVVVGDIGADVEAARRAGTYGILVPTPATRPRETAAAAHVAPDLETAVRALLAGSPPGRAPAGVRPVRAAYTGGGAPAPGRPV